MVEGIGGGLVLLRWEGRERGGGVGWSGVEWSGVEWSGVENGMELWWGGAGCVGERGVEGEGGGLMVGKMVEGGEGKVGKGVSGS